MIDLKRVKDYIELGWDKDQALEMVKDEAANEPAPANDDTPVKVVDTNEGKYLTKEDLDKYFQERKLKEAGSEAPETESPSDIMTRIFGKETKKK